MARPYKFWVNQIYRSIAKSVAYVRKGEVTRLVTMAFSVVTKRVRSEYLPLSPHLRVTLVSV